MPLELINRILDDHERMRQAIELLDRRLYHLRYEGKKQESSNFQQVKEYVLFLQKDMDRRVLYEEGVLFPFLTNHVPRLEPVFNWLRIDHEQCRLEFNRLTNSLSNKSLEEALQHGDYLSGLLRSHWMLEEKNGMASLQNELKGHEKERLKRLWVVWEAEICENTASRGNHGQNDSRYPFF